MSRFAGAPALADTQDALRGPYAARFQDFTEAGRQERFLPAQQDSERIAVLLVDYQHDFVDPTGTLYVPGAREDVARFLTWFYANAAKITSIYASQDTHQPLQIFFSSWWEDPTTHEHPQPFTTITEQDISSGRWVARFQREWSERYVQLLATQAKKDLMIWPHHTMQGTLGHMLVAPISEALAWHSAARETQPTFIVKGLTPRTEYYGIFGAEISDPADSSSELRLSLLESVMQHDKIYIAGEARSHCVLETERQLVEYSKDRPELLKRLYILTDCASSVQHPEIDFDRLADTELELMQQRGVQMVRSIEAI